MLNSSIQTQFAKCSRATRAFERTNDRSKDAAAVIMNTTTRPYPALSALFGTPPEVFTRRSGVRYSTHPSGTLEMS